MPSASCPLLLGFFSMHLDVTMHFVVSSNASLFTNARLTATNHTRTASMRSWICVVVALLWCGVADLHAAIINSNSCALADVQSAVIVAHAADVVSIPAG